MDQQQKRHLHTKSGYNCLLSLRDPIKLIILYIHGLRYGNFNFLKRLNSFFVGLSQFCAYSRFTIKYRKMNPSATSTRCGLQDELFLHCIQDCEFSRSLWNHASFNNLDFFSNLDVYDWLKLGATCSHTLIFSAGVWWSWRHRNMMCLNNEIWSLSWLSFHIQAMVKTFRNYFPPTSNDDSDDRYVKWNNNNYLCHS
jgi:hypothetical protein